MMLDGTARKYLRGRAHALRPAVHVGKEGLTEAVVNAIRTSFEAHELIKIKLQTERDERRAWARAIAEKTGSECVGEIGHMAVFFRRHPDPDKQTIDLPGHS